MIIKINHVTNILILVLFSAINTNLIFSQNFNNNITFILKKYDSGKFYTTLPNGEKYIEFKISGLTDQRQVDTLEKHISNYRGVVSFSISNEIADNQRTGMLKSYKYVENLLYYKHMFLTNNINHLVVDGKEILTEDLLEFEK